VPKSFKPSKVFPFRSPASQSGGVSNLVWGFILYIKKNGVDRIRPHCLAREPSSTLNPKCHPPRGAETLGNFSSFSRAWNSRTLDLQSQTPPTIKHTHPGAVKGSARSPVPRARGARGTTAAGRRAGTAAGKRCAAPHLNCPQGPRLRDVSVSSHELATFRGWGERTLLQEDGSISYVATPSRWGAKRCVALPAFGARVALPARAFPTASGKRGGTPTGKRPTQNLDVEQKFELLQHEPARATTASGKRGGMATEKQWAAPPPFPAAANTGSHFYALALKLQAPNALLSGKTEATVTFGKTVTLGKRCALRTLNTKP
jgi:hypothetical protein